MTEMSPEKGNKSKAPPNLPKVLVNDEESKPPSGSTAAQARLGPAGAALPPASTPLPPPSPPVALWSDVFSCASLALNPTFEPAQPGSP